MLSVSPKSSKVQSRSPCGERGLKYLDVSEAKESDDVAPRAGSVG